MPEQVMKILLVEDDDLDVFTLQRLMKKNSLDYPIIRAANGEEALDILRPAEHESALLPPYIVLLDINMPRMNGYELLEALQDDEILIQVPIYVLSTSSSEHDQAKVRQYDVIDYVIKPITAQRLKNILELADPTLEGNVTSFQPSAANDKTHAVDHRSEECKSRDLLLHDMKGPIVNIRGFANMSIESLSTLRQLIEENKLGMDTEQIQSAHDLVVEDLQPYLNYLSQTIITLQERIQRYEEQ